MMNGLNIARLLTLKAKANKMQKLNLITAALAGIGLGLLFIGAAENVFTSGECMLGGLTCALSFIVSITWEG
jgi:hypothetical protein